MDSPDFSFALRWHRPNDAPAHSGTIVVLRPGGLSAEVYDYRLPTEAEGGAGSLWDAGGECEVLAYWWSFAADIDAWCYAPSGHVPLHVKIIGEGRAAHVAGRPATENPYQADTCPWRWRLWGEGWRRAHAAIPSPA